MWDDHHTQMEVRSKVKCFPERVREGSQIDNLIVDLIRTRKKKEKQKVKLFGVIRFLCL